MTANWAGVVVNVLVLAFFVVVALAVGLAAYAATTLRKMEKQQENTAE